MVVELERDEEDGIEEKLVEAMLGKHNSWQQRINDLSDLRH